MELILPQLHCLGYMQIQVLWLFFATRFLVFVGRMGRRHLQLPRLRLCSGETCVPLSKWAHLLWRKVSFSAPYLFGICNRLSERYSRFGLTFYCTIRRFPLEIQFYHTHPEQGVAINSLVFREGEPNEWLSQVGPCSSVQPMAPPVGLKTNLVTYIYGSKHSVSSGIELSDLVKLDTYPSFGSDDSTAKFRFQWRELGEDYQSGDGHFWWS